MHQPDPPQNPDGQAIFQKELFTLTEVATMLSLSERTVEGLVAHGHLRSAVAPGTDRSRRVSRSMIEEYRGLAIVFGILAVALAAYFVKSMLAGRHPPPPPPESVYIEPVLVPPKADPPAAP